MDAIQVTDDAIHLLYRSLAEIDAQQRSLRRAYHDLNQLHQVAPTRRPAATTIGRWQQLTAAAVVRLGADLAQLAATEVLDLTTGEALQTLVPAAHPVRHRIICDRAVLESPPGDVLVDSWRQRADIRLGRDIPAALRLVDGEHVLVQPPAEHAPAAYIRSARVAGALRQFFELSWRDATPWSVGSRPAEITPSQWRVLRLISLGLDDDTLARVTGTTVKTVRAHVAGLLRVLNAPTRFAAGAEAAARGWLR